VADVFFPHRITVRRIEQGDEVILNYRNPEVNPVIPDESFDLVMCNDVLEHLDVSHRRQAIRELARVARRWMLVSVPFEEDLLQSAAKCGRCGHHYHINHHTRSFGLRSLRRLLEAQPFHCRRQLLSGDIWRRDPPTIVALRCLLGLSNATTDSLVCPVCGSGETALERQDVPLTEFLDAASASLCIAEPDLVAHGLQRTECISLFERISAGDWDVPCEKRDHTEAGGFRWLGNHGRPVDLPSVLVRSNEIDFHRPEIYATPVLPRFSRLPYLIADNPSDEIRILRPGRPLSCGFFPPSFSLDRDVKLIVRGRALTSCRLSTAHYSNSESYRFARPVRVQGKFVKSVSHPAVISRYGCLFQLQVQQGEIELESVALRTGHGREFLLADNRNGAARYLVRGGRPELAVSLPAYGRYLDVEGIIESALHERPPTMDLQSLNVPDKRSRQLRRSLHRLRTCKKFADDPGFFEIMCRKLQQRSEAMRRQERSDSDVEETIVPAEAHR